MIESEAKTTLFPKPTVFYLKNSLIAKNDETNSKGKFTCRVKSFYHQFIEMQELFS